MMMRYAAFLLLCIMHSTAWASEAPPSSPFSRVAEQVNPSVVVIDVTGRESAPDDSTTVTRSTGTGVIWSAAGEVVTAAHVLEGAVAVSVRLYDGRRYAARLLGRDMATDLAVLRIDAKDLKPAKLGRSMDLAQGDWVVAIGSPYGLSYSVTAGVLSAKGRGGIGANVIEDYLQTDASLNPGNSGGPLCDLSGRVVGINSMVVAETRGIGFSVPVEMASAVASALVQRGRVSRPWLGVDFQDLTPDLARAMGAEPYLGVLLGGVQPAGPGAPAKLSPGDVLTRLAGQPLKVGRDLVSVLTTLSPGQVVSAEVWRKGERYQTQITLAERPESSPPLLPMERPSAEQGLGLVLRAKGKASKDGYAVVDKVALGSAADRAAVRRGDLVLAADGVDKPTPADLTRVSADGEVLLHLMRGARSFWVALKK